VGEVRDPDLVVSGNVEAKFALTEIDTGLRPAIKKLPSLTLLDLVDDFGWTHADLKRAETLLVELMGNDDLIRLLAIAHDGAIKVVLIDLEQNIVLRIRVIEYPLHCTTLERHSGEDERSRGRNNTV